MREYPFLFNDGDRPDNEIVTLENMYEECTYLYGTDLYYIPIELYNEEDTFGEYLSRVASIGISFRGFVEQTDEFEGNGYMFTKFGLQLQDEMNVFVLKRILKNKNIIPKENDLIYHKRSDKIFEIEFIDDDKNGSNFYPLGANISYRIRCKLYNNDYRTDFSLLNSEQVEDASNEIIKKLDLLNTQDVEENNIPLENINTDNDIIDNEEIDPLMRGL